MYISTAAACPLTVLAWRLTALPLSELWLRYIEIGGNRPQRALEAYLGGNAEWPASEHNALAHALNESLWALDCPTLAPYRAPSGTWNEPPDELERHPRDQP